MVADLINISSMSPSFDHSLAISLYQGTTYFANPEQYSNVVDQDRCDWKLAIIS